MADGVDLGKKFVSESELEENRKKRQEEWEKVRKPDDPEEVPEEEYDPRSLYERLQEQKDKKQEEYEEQFKFKNMVKGLEEDETSFLDEVSRQQCLIEKRRRDEDAQEIKEYRISFLRRTQFYFTPVCVSVFFLTDKRHSALQKLASGEGHKKEPEKKAGPKPSEHRTSHLSQAHLLAGAVKRRSSSQSSEGSKKLKAEETVAGNGSQTEQEAVDPKSPGTDITRSGVLHLPSAAVCVGILPGLGAYSGSSDSESSSDSEV
ncbi:protein FAM192A [Triplophysa rosa]|uniref:Protein FAM192A n=1 Tax=Triplophysa rosa TaxID=992332 RepID=A0A9W7WLV4_TRIRA|nr:protein FAM192A [Triplophysa rosa]